jgi:hypothetical protein
MREQLSSKTRETRQCKPRGTGWMILPVSLVMGIAMA